MSLCDSCRYRYNVEQLKPCIIRKDDCEFYKKEEAIKMRDATPEEREAVDDYIKSISKPTGVDFLDLDQEPNTGHWIIYDVHGHKACKCSECDKDVGYPCYYKYCPYCGIRIIGSKELC